MKLVIILTFSILYESVLTQPPVVLPDIGGECPPSNTCPDICVLKGVDEICVCRLFHKEDDGLTWKAGYESCTDDYSPWALNPYEGGDVLANPYHAVEIVPDDKLTDEG